MKLLMAVITLGLTGLTNAAQINTAGAEPASATSQTEARRSRLGLELAEVLNSEPLTRAQLDKMIRVTFPNVFGQNPNFVALEKRYPGAISAIIAALAPITIEITIKSLPELWQKLAPIYANSFTVSELEELLIFYRGPTGRNLIDAMGRGSDFSLALSRAAEGANSTLTTNDLRSGAAGGIAEVIRLASAADEKAIAALASTTAGAKLPGVTLRGQKVVADWSNRPTPELDARIEKLTLDALNAHIQKSANP